MRLELVSQVILASSDSSSGDPRLFGLALFASGFVFYGWVYLRYRNTDKRHMHESETEARMLGVRGADQQIDTLKGVKNSKLKGANNRDVRGGRGKDSGGFVAGAMNTAMGQIPGGRRLRP